jgi:RNA polymerase sigma-70 factor (ECF subfamily)
VAGLTAGQIARTFLVSESTLAQRLVRETGVRRGISLGFPPLLLPERLSGVLAVVYLIYQGLHAAHDKPPHAEPGSDPARLIPRSCPTTALGLVALLLLHDSRAATRYNTAGDVVC